MYPSSLEDRSSTLPTRSSTSDLDKSTSNSLVQPKKSRSRRRRRSSQRRKNQPPKNEWKEDEEHKEPMKDEPTPPKSRPQTKQVWKEKVTSPLETQLQDVQPSRSPSLRPDDAPEE